MDGAWFSNQEQGQCSPSSSFSSFSSSTSSDRGLAPTRSRRANSNLNFNSSTAALAGNPRGAAPGAAAAQPCWWRLAETKRTVNQTCVDGRVIAAVRARRPQCWSACPQPNNATTPCYLDCLFTTMLGNKSLGVPPMTTESIVAPFVEAFSGDGKGCPSVTPTPGANWAQ